MTLAELAEALDLAPRQIRFLISEGILPAAQKTGRHADAYGPDHLARARHYMALSRMGMKPASIKVLMAFDQAVPIFQADGVELRIDPAGLPDTPDVEALIDSVAQALRTYLGKDRT